LRADLEKLAISQNDRGTVAVLAADVGRRAEKTDDMDTAIAAYRKAIAAGSTDAKVADRLSIWLVKQGLHAEAAAALTQALRQPPETASTRERLQKRLQRCQRALS
jgi:Tfp pilus assembly protein PilF